MGRKYCGKRRKCCLAAFSPCPTMFSKSYLSRVVKSLECMVELKHWIAYYRWSLTQVGLYFSFTFYKSPLMLKYFKMIFKMHNKVKIKTFYSYSLCYSLAKSSAAASMSTEVEELSQDF